MGLFILFCYNYPRRTIYLDISRQRDNQTEFTLKTGVLRLRDQKPEIKNQMFQVIKKWEL